MMSLLAHDELLYGARGSERACTIPGSRLVTVLLEGRFSSEDFTLTPELARGLY